ncbi:Uma2 family endonuclease [Streptomyces sp. FL07-04A]|uniref:Uma2 family endonuclease n=1 Tax=Streptomyces sp. FL07-04A TaxID=3028658 RepID=UPI0029AEBBD9|nr:Uma2 family endonuclease [Streptomyces sp. FL07-04A]MDX3578811.1 Uma2 family endonuclease [Streptomyces sp. FL07-04A]
MSALTVDHSTAGGHEWDRLVRIWQETDAPEGCKVEIIEGIVTVAPPPSNAHNDIADQVQRELYLVIPREWGIYQSLGTAVPSRVGLYIPDIAVAPKEVLRTGAGNCVPASEAELIVEITSKANASNDRIRKAAGYAQAGVPLYLLIDSWAPGGPTVTLYGEPQGDLYRVLRAGKFGDTVELPEPFGLKLDTADFPAG